MKIPAKVIMELDFDESNDEPVDGWTLLACDPIGAGNHSSTSYQVVVSGVGKLWAFKADFHDEVGWFGDGFTKTGQSASGWEIRDLEWVGVAEVRAEQVVVTRYVPVGSQS